MRDPLVSIITPNFNGSDFISETIGSVQEQSFTNYEHIIVDDASTDSSLNVISARALEDSRIRLLKNGRQLGPAHTRNRAIEAARGRFIAFLDGDDLWLPEKLEVQINLMVERRLPFTHSFYERINEEGRLLNETIKAPGVVSYSDMLKKCHIGCLTAVYDRGQLGLQLMPDIERRQDYALWLQILRSTQEAVCIPKVLARYRIRKQSVSRNKFALIQYNYRVFKEFEKLGRLRSAYYLAWNIFHKIRRA